MTGVVGRRPHRQLHDGTFADKNVGTGKTVTVTAISSAAPTPATTPANTTATTTADITGAPDHGHRHRPTPRPPTARPAPLPSQRSPSIRPRSATRATSSRPTTPPAAGTGKTLTPSGTVNDGNGGANYAVTFVNNTTGVITAGAPNKLVFLQQPTDEVVSDIITPAVTVQATDLYGNPTPSASGNVTLSSQHHQRAGTLSGTLTQPLSAASRPSTTSASTTSGTYTSPPPTAR